MLNQSDQKRDVQGKLIAQARLKKKKKNEDCQNILLFTVMWLAKENMSVHRLILYLLLQISVPAFSIPPAASFLPQRAELGME